MAMEEERNRENRSTSGTKQHKCNFLHFKVIGKRRETWIISATSYFQNSNQDKMITPSLKITAKTDSGSHN